MNYSYLTNMNYNAGIYIRLSQEDKNKKFCYLKYNHIPYKILYKINKKKCRIITIYPFDVDEYNNIEEQKKLERIQKAISFLEKEGYTICKHS